MNYRASVVDAIQMVVFLFILCEKGKSNLLSSPAPLDNPRGRLLELIIED
jgi:hypothetical protein